MRTDFPQPSAKKRETGFGLASFFLVGLASAGAFCDFALLATLVLHPDAREAAPMVLFAALTPSWILLAWIGLRVPRLKDRRAVDPDFD